MQQIQKSMDEISKTDDPAVKQELMQQHYEGYVGSNEYDALYP